MRILVLRGGALGDFVVTLPALALLRQRWPGARIELIGNSAAAALALPSRLIDAVHSQHESRWAALYAPGPLPEGRAAWLGDFDLILNFWPDPARELARRFPLRPGQIFLTAEALPTIAPAARHYCEPLRELGLSPNTFLHRLRSPRPEPRRIALHPGSGSARKNWPADRWLALAHWLEQELHAEVIVISGEAEAAGLLAGIGLHLRNLPLNMLADELARCRFFVGHDSGVSHLAAAAGVPGVLLFGPTDPAIWAPPSPTMRVLRRDNELASIPLAEVRQAVAAALPDRS
jgi:ADP-heptose:LPS heptosyltransferase